MDGIFPFNVVFVVIMVILGHGVADHEYMVNSPENLYIPMDFQTQLTCEMNIPPDKFLWKFYPFEKKDIYNPKVVTNLNNASYRHLHPEKHEGKKSTLNVKAQSNELSVAGDYQCLAYYGASAVASVPSKITLSVLEEFTDTSIHNVDICPGNLVFWRCVLPFSNPDPVVDYYKNDNYVKPSESLSHLKSLIIENVTSSDSATYNCRATSLLTSTVVSKERLNLRVSYDAPWRKPFFISKPKDLYTVTRGSDVILECSAVGTPVPNVRWTKLDGQLPYTSQNIGKGLKISKVSSKDEGVYICDHENPYGSLIQRITLVYNEEPSIECSFNSTDIKQGENLEIDCSVKGIPEPQIAWFLNGYTVKNDSAIEAVENKIYFSSIEKRHAGNLQCFASNIVKTVYSSISIKVIPLSTNGDGFVTSMTHRRNSKTKHPARKPTSKHSKAAKCIPPNKPTVTRINDQAVVVRWSVNSNNGLPIQFFKVQYRELGPHNDHHKSKGAKWRTCNSDIPPTIRSYEVNGLKPDYVYRFRIAAVYSNNDNKPSNNSDKFHLRKMDFDEDDKPPTPLITHTEALNTTSVKIYWQRPADKNKSVIGYFINFMSASRAGDFSKESVDGANTTFYILSNLQPDTVYDIKLQSYTPNSVSPYSQILQVKTQALQAVSSTTVPAPPPNPEQSGVSNLYIFIAVGVLGVALLVTAVVVLFLCRNWKQKKNADGDRHKPSIEDHHIQADGGDYVVNQRSLPRTNGCAVPGNKITITANPLADAESKIYQSTK